MKTLRRLLGGFIAVASMMICLEASSDKTYDLRGPARKVGDTAHNEFTMAWKGTVTIQIGDNRIQGKVEVNGKGLVDTEVLAVADGEVTRFKETIISDHTKIKMSMNGETTEEVEHEPLEGRTILHSFEKGFWKRTLVGKSPTAEQQRSLAAANSWYWDTGMHPEQKVKPGHTWTVKDARLRKLVGGFDLLTFSGKAPMIFEKVVEFQDEMCALITVSMDIQGKMLGDDNDEMAVEMGLGGSYYHSLETGIDLQGELKGQVKVQGLAENLQITIRGPITLKWTTQWR